MEFVAGLQSTSHKIRTTIDLSFLVSPCPQPFRAKQTDASMTSSMLRLHVMRRDHYRCRGCGKMGDEITLEVRRIKPDASDSNAMLTLCVHCRKLVEQGSLAATSSSEFLQHLRHQLGFATATQSQTLTTGKSGLKQQSSSRCALHSFWP